MPRGLIARYLTVGWVLLAETVSGLRAGPAAEALPVFKGVSIIGKADMRFVLLGPDQRQSGWLRVDETFEGFRLRSYDRGAAVLTVERDGKVYALPLEPEATLDGGRSLNVTIAGMVVPLGSADAKRVLGKIEALAGSANFNTLVEPGITWGREAEWTPPAQMTSFLHVAYASPRLLSTHSGPLRVSDIWVEIEDGTKRGGSYPGPVTVIVDGQPVHLIKVSGMLSLELGRDPALLDHLPPKMKHDLRQLAP